MDAQAWFATAIAALALIHASHLEMVSSYATEKTESGSTALQKRATPKVQDRHNGIASVYDQGGAAGSCGHTHTDGSRIVAIGNCWWDKHGHGYLCDRFVRVTNTGPAGDNSIGGKGNSIRARVADTCPGCMSTHLDLSRGACGALTNSAADSVVGMKWYGSP